MIHHDPPCPTRTHHAASTFAPLLHRTLFHLQSAMAAASHALLGQLRPSRPTAVPDTALTLALTLTPTLTLTLTLALTRCRTARCTMAGWRPAKRSCCSTRRAVVAVLCSSCAVAVL